MGVALGGGWSLVHLADRVVELRKETYEYRRFTGRDGYVRVRADPGMDRNALIEKAVTMAKRNDEKLAEVVGRRLMPYRLGQYRQDQRRYAPMFATPEDPDVIGVKR